MTQNIQPGILHLIDTTGPGGAETIFTQLAFATQQQGYRSIAVIRGEGWVAAELRRLEIPTLILDCKGSFNITFLRSLIKVIREEHITLIQSHLLGSNVYASLAGLLTGTPVFSTFHGFVDVSPKERLRLLKFLIIQLGSRRVIAVTQQMCEMLQAVPTLRRKKVITIPNGVDTELYKKNNQAMDLRKLYGLDSDSLLMGCLGNVRKAKNYNLAIETLFQLRQKGIKAILCIAGDNQNSLADTHREYARQLNVDGFVVWLGFLDRPVEYLNGLNIFLLSSSTEGHPLALTQAMAVELPVVATRCGIEELFKHEETLLLAPVGDAATLAKQIERAINEPALREMLKQNARRLVESRFSLKAMCRSYLECYKPYLP